MSKRVKEMRNFIMMLLAGWLGMSAYAAHEDQCSQSTYRCLDPQGVEFGTVGPVRMWFNRAEQGCIASPHSLADGCILLAQMCNNLYPARCKNDCLPGQGASYVLERSCEGMVPISPNTSVPNIHHDTFFYQDHSRVYPMTNWQY